MNIIVDLDGTLLKTDMLCEAVVAKISKNFKETINILKVLLLNNRLEFKNYAFKDNTIDINTLPFNQEVISKVKKLKKSGNKIYLVTASPTNIAIKINEALKIFDNVYGSTDEVNLKGEEKKKLLNKLFGKKNYHYFGNSKEDLHVWKDSGYAYLVNVSFKIKNKVNDIRIPFESIETKKSKFEIFKSVIRIKQWIKNILIFVPLIAAQAFTLENYIQCLYAFVSFSMIASGVYIFNDLLDIRVDRHHEIKKNRVFASGEMQLETGFVIGVLLWIIGFILTSAINTSFLWALVVYSILTSLYSIKLKKIPIIDLCTLSILYTLRIWSGSVANEIQLSVWLLALSIFLFYSLACVKRLGELSNNKLTGRLTIKDRGYDIKDIPIVQSMAVSTGNAATIVFALYLNSTEIVKYYSYPPALWVIWLVLLYWVNYIIFMANRGKINEDPVIFAIKNKISIICGFLIIIFMIIGIFYE